MMAALLAASCEKEEDPGRKYIAESVTLDLTDMVIEVGQVELLWATVLPENLIDKTVVWRSSNNKIVTVNEAGEVEGVGTGQTMVTAYTLNGRSAACSITVTDVVAMGISLNVPALSLLVGEKQTVQATVLPLDAVQRVTWSSNNEDVATVSKTGEITAVATGSATVTATTHNGIAAGCAVTVTNIPATGITLPPTFNVAAGGTEKLTATVLPFPGALQAVTWSSSNPGVVSVDAATGEITALGAANSTAVITATVVENTSYKATCTVTILPSITLTLNGYSGAAATLTYTDNTVNILALVNNKVSIISTPDAKTIKNITLENGTTLLIGRKANSDITLKFTGTSLAFRDAVDGAIPIGSYAEFQLIRGTAVSGTYKQEANIDLMSEPWTPVGESSNHFSGTFDGAGFALENLYVNSTSGEGKGLFGWATGAIFNRVWVKSGSVTSTQSCTGGICGWSKSATFSGCSNNAAVNGANNSTAGISGYGCSLFIACRNSGAITTSGQYAGGIVAYCFDNGSVTGIVACYNTGAISGTGAATYNIGGIAGQMNGSRGILACYNTGAVTFTTSAAATIGGIAGTNNAVMQGCYWSSNNASAAGAGTGTPTNTQKFGAAAWPATSVHAQWGVGNGSADNTYWKSLGSWNGGSPTYPKLFFEE
jgi:uncharacterized protein YjdB